MFYWLLMLAPLAVIITLSMYKAVRLFGRNSRRSLVSKVCLCAFHSVTVIVCILVALKLTIPPIRYSLRIAQYEEYIIQRHPVIEKVSFDATRGDYEVVFIIAKDSVSYDTCETIFLTSLDQLRDAQLREAFKNGSLLDKNNGSSKISFIFADTMGQRGAKYQFEMPEYLNYNKWKVMVSWEPEHRNKEYYLDIAPQPPVSSDIGMGDRIL